MFLKKPLILAGILFITFFTFNDSLQAKRSAPKSVEPVTFNGVKYTVPLDPEAHVEAYDVSTNQLLWRRRIFKVNYNPHLERDVQWVFISSLRIEDGQLIVTNHLDEEYAVNLATKKIKKIKQGSGKRSTSLP